MSRVSSFSRMIPAILLPVLCITGSPILALAGQNPDFRLVLHAKQSSFEPCNGYLPVDCTASQPTVNVVPGAPVVIFLLLANYQQATGVQTAFNWSGWTLIFANWNCLLLCDPVPCTFPLGASGGTIAGTFPGCIEGPALQVIGSIAFVAGGYTTCMRQVQPTAPMGIHLVDCNSQIDQILDSQSPRLGRICVESGGVNACPPAVPVEAATWGSIKATY